MQKNVSRRDALKTAAALAAGGTALLGAAPAIGKSSRQKLRMQTHWPPGVGYYKPVYEGFAHRVNTITGGELNIKPLPYNTVVPTKDIFDAVSRGMLDIAFTWPTYWAGKLPVAVHLNGQIGTWDNFSEMWSFMKYSGALEIIRQAYAEHGIHLVGPVACGPVGLYSKTPLRTMDDFKGYKVRSTGLAAKVLQKMGATPVFFPATELYQSLQTGVCDGAHWGGPYGGWEMRLYEVTDYYIWPNLGQVSNGEILVNKKKWDNMDPSQQKAIEDCCLATSADAGAWLTDKDIIALGNFREKGGKLSVLEDDVMRQLRKHAMEVVDDYSAKDPKYCARVGTLLHDFMTQTQKI